MTKKQELNNNPFYESLKKVYDEFPAGVPVEFYLAIQEDNTALREANNKLYQECFDLYTAIAPKLGFKPFGKGQIKWALSQEDADAIELGESVFKYVEAALNKIRNEG